MTVDQGHGPGLGEPDTPASPAIPHMPRDDFRRHGRATIDWIADYWRDIEALPVLSRAAPGEVYRALPPSAPQRGEPFEAMMRDVQNIILPGITHWQSPRFFAYFPANVSEPSVLGELLSAGLGVQGMLWATSPACTELETRVLDWLVDMLGLPEAFASRGRGGGVIQDTASSATLCALIAARERLTGGAGNRTGTPPDLRVYASTQAHSAIDKAARIAGIGSDNLRKIAVGPDHAMRTDDLERAIARDQAAGLRPCMVCATVGTTSSNAIDPLPAIGAICRDRGVWLHVDAAMSGTAALCPEFRAIHAGLDLADSYCFNPHKWMLTNFDCDCFYVADRSALIDALSITPEFLRNRASESGQVFDYRDWQVPLGRRFRALKLWFVIRHYGVEGLQRLVRAHVDLARTFAGWVKADPRFELTAEPPLNLVCFRHRGSDESNQTLLDRLNRSGRAYLTHTRLDDRLTLRMSIAQARTEGRHVEEAWRLIRQAADGLDNGD